MTTARKAACVLVAWVLVAAGLSDLGSARAPLDLGSSKPQREFDYFALSLQWPGTICASTRHCCSINGCCRYVFRTAPSRRPCHDQWLPSPHLILSTKRRELAAPRPIDQFFLLPISVGLIDARPHAVLFSLSCPACSSEPLQTFTIRKCSLRPRSISFLYMFRQVNS